MNPRNGGFGEIALRNRVLKEMGNVSPPGRKVELSTGQDVIFWFNVGAPGPPRSRVYVTQARCPHQGVCLLGSELMEIEDLASGRRALTRCPRHNKRFDLSSGESAGNSEKLQRYSCRFEHGCWYVGIGPAQAAKEVGLPAHSATAASTPAGSEASTPRRWRGASALARRLCTSTASPRQRGSSLPPAPHSGDLAARRRSNSFSPTLSMNRPKRVPPQPRHLGLSARLSNVETPCDIDGVDKSRKPIRKKARRSTPVGYGATP